MLDIVKLLKKKQVKVNLKDYFCVRVISNPQVVDKPQVVADFVNVYILHL